jgi:uncharacterized protein (TIGR00159 family)
MLNSLKLFFSTITIRDIVDIFINSYILFRIYVLFYGTALFRSLIGIAILFICQRLSSNIGLIMTSYIIQGIITIALFILVIAFRHEIRGILQTRNISDIFWRLTRRRVDKSKYQDIIDAVFSLSEKKVGALVVIPGRHSVGPFVSGGVKLESLISQELIETLFMSRGPLHDGAILIEQNRIKRAGVVLPLSLSEKVDLPSFYGMRHRAALSLSEVCDALIIVVSEERGTISIAHGMEIFPIHDKKDLKLILDSHYGSVEERKINRQYLRFSIAAIMCFLIVTGVWFTFTRGQTTFSSIKVPIEIIKKSPDIEIVNASPNNVKLTLSGPRVILRSVNVNDINLFVKVKEEKPGTYVYDLTAKNLSLPPGINILKLNPSKITIKLDKIITKILPVQVNWVGKLNPDILIKKCTPIPAKVKLRGPESILSSISTVYTEPIKVDGIKASGEVISRLQIDPSIKVEDMGYEVRVRYWVERRLP